MTIQLEPELRALIQEDVDKGAYQSIEDFVEAAVRLLHCEEELLQHSKDSIHEKIGRGLAQLDRGEGIPGDVSRVSLQEKKAAFLTHQAHQ